MKKSFILIIVLISLFIVGCDIDHYKGMRPLTVTLVYVDIDIEFDQIILKRTK